MSRLKWAAIWALALLMLCSSIALAGEGAVITLLESAVVPGGDITLRQIAHIEGPPEIGEVVVGRAPFPGQSRRVHRGYVLVRLRQAGIRDAAVVGAEEVEVRTKLQAAEGEPIQVLLTAVDIPYNQIISEDMLQVDVLPAAEAPPGALKSPEEAVGKRSTRYLRAGSVLTDGALDAVPLIQRGQQVEILAMVGDVSVSAPGIARSDGRRGELIPVVNSLSNRIVHGIVLDGERVLVK
ncbi:MAG: flagellar basal body P-ring formation protein FlgA [Firmicutes bacterium]|nr:flagellar basal body P-ring formation protein FlgA [Bacillota bacterium]